MWYIAVVDYIFQKWSPKYFWSYLTLHHDPESPSLPPKSEQIFVIVWKIECRGSDTTTMFWGSLCHIERLTDQAWVLPDSQNQPSYMQMSKSSDNFSSQPSNYCNCYWVEQKRANATEPCPNYKFVSKLCCHCLSNQNREIC